MRNIFLSFCLCLAVNMPAVFAGNPITRTLKSHHYQIHTNLPRSVVEPFAVRMDKIFNDYSQRFAGFHSNSNASGKMNLFLLATRKGYVQFMARQGINAKNSGGMFFVNSKQHGLATWALGRSKSQTFSVLQHEGFHQFVYNHIGTGLPQWINEGLAQYYQDGIMINGRLQLGLANARRLKLVKSAIKNKRFVRLKKLVTISNRSWAEILNTQPQVSNIMYAQSWSAVYFLIYADGGQYKQSFLKYLHLVAAGTKSKMAFKQAFGTNNFKAVQRQWIGYVKNQQPSPISIAINRLQFLGAGMKYIITRQHQMPHSLDDLRRMLSGFYTVRSLEGITIKQSVSSEMFRYKTSNGQIKTFKMVQQRGLPPALTAADLNPQVALTWTRDRQGNLETNIIFR